MGNAAIVFSVAGLCKSWRASLPCIASSVPPQRDVGPDRIPAALGEGVTAPACALSPSAHQSLALSCSVRWAGTMYDRLEWETLRFRCTQSAHQVSAATACPLEEGSSSRVLVCAERTLKWEILRFRGSRGWGVGRATCNAPRAGASHGPPVRGVVSAFILSAVRWFPSTARQAGRRRCPRRRREPAPPSPPAPTRRC